jgi:hypothetical protein
MDDDTTAATPSRHVSVWIDASPDAVYALASDPAELPRWAAGLADPSLSDAVVDFAPRNEFFQSPVASLAPPCSTTWFGCRPVRRSTTRCG